MNEPIRLMQQHSSVRRFQKEEIPEETLKTMIDAGRAASTWKNFQSYSIIVVRSQEKKEALYDLLPQPAIQESAVVLLFVGDHRRAREAASLHQQAFDARGVENLLISSVDASLAAQNTLLAAESLGYGGVFIGMIRHVAQAVSDLFALPDYTYPVFCLALGKPNQAFPVKPRLPYESVVFEESYQEPSLETIRAYDAVQTAYAGARQKETWSQRMVAQFGQEEHPETRELLNRKKLL